MREIQHQNDQRNIAHALYVSEVLADSNHRRLVFIAARNRLALGSSLGCHGVLAWVENEAWVTNIEEDRSEGDHTV